MIGPEMIGPEMIGPELLIAACLLLGVMVISAAALRGWQGWLSLKQRELELLRRPLSATSDQASGSREGAARIELADLKERIRRLEAIANGVDL